MNKNEYINRLSESLDRYDVKNKIDVLADYEQIVDEILLDNDDNFDTVIEKLGYPEILAIEIADELGYETKRDQPKQFKEQANSNQYNKKRYKSNVVWNILIWLYGIIQFALTTSIIIMVVFVAYFGLNSTLNIDSSFNNDNTYTTKLEVCGNNNCQTFETNSSYYQGNHHDFSYHGQDNNITIYIGPLALASTLIVAIFMWFNYILVYKNIRRVIVRNNEYNRRRQYE